MPKRINGKKITTQMAIKAIIPWLKVGLTAAEEKGGKASPTLLLSWSYMV
jgi:hypothetical protein